MCWTQYECAAYLAVQSDIIQDQALFQSKSFEPAVYPANSIPDDLKKALVDYGAGQVIKHGPGEYMLQELGSEIFLNFSAFSKKKTLFQKNLFSKNQITVRLVAQSQRSSPPSAIIFAVSQYA